MITRPNPDWKEPMNSNIGTTVQWIRNAIVTTAFLTACADTTPVGPDRSQASQPPVTANAWSADLASCQDLKAREGSVLIFHAFAKGVQTYHWNGASWVFDGPTATLYSDAEGKAVVGTHYAGPWWESNSGSKVKGAVDKKCVVDANSIPWLLLNGGSSEGPGIFNGVTQIQRVNTVGGNAPTTGGYVGEVANVAYTAEYFFYRAP
jgi:hypothetical protein